MQIFRMSFPACSPLVLLCHPRPLHLAIINQQTSVVEQLVRTIVSMNQRKILDTRNHLQQVTGTRYLSLSPVLRDPLVFSDWLIIWFSCAGYLGGSKKCELPPTTPVWGSPRTGLRELVTLRKIQ